MVWKTVTYESIDIRDGFLHELFLTGHEMVVTLPRAGEKRPGEAHKFSGIEKGRGPVAFLATDSLAKDMNLAAEGNMLPMLVRIQWKGKVAIKGGEQMFNVFACEQYVPDLDAGETFPEWTTKSALAQAEKSEMIRGEDLPEEGPVDERPDDSQFGPDR